MLIAFSIGVTATAYPENTADKFRELVAMSARRLEIARQIALAKWDTGTPVEDASRESQVISSAIKDGQSMGLDPRFVTDFFKAQIEANKLVQYSLLANWHRAGAAPPHRPSNLAANLRPELDRLQRDLLEQLVQTAPVRGTSGCNAALAKSVGKYLVDHQLAAGSLEAIALDRAVAASCTF